MTRSKSRAFSLVELLLAMTVASILILVLSHSTSMGLALWEKSRGKMEKESSARYFLDRLSHEMSACRTSETLKFSSPDKNKVVFVSPYLNEDRGDLCMIEYSWSPETKSIEKRFLKSKQAHEVDFDLDHEEAKPLQISVLSNVIEFTVECLTVENDRAFKLVDPWIDETQKPELVRVSIVLVDGSTMAKLNLVPPGSNTYDDLLIRNQKRFSREIALTP